MILIALAFVAEQLEIMLFTHSRESSLIVGLNFGIDYKSNCQPLEVSITSASFSYSLGVTPGFLRSYSSSTWLSNSAIRFEDLEGRLSTSFFTFYNFSQNSRIYSCFRFHNFGSISQSFLPCLKRYFYLQYVSRFRGACHFFVCLLFYLGKF